MRVFNPQQFDNKKNTRMDGFGKRFDSPRFNENISICL